LTAAAGGDTPDGATKEKFIIQINFGDGEKSLIYEKDIMPIAPQPAQSDDGDLP
jgi:hypothetical protein